MKEQADRIVIGRVEYLGNAQEHSVDGVTVGRYERYTVHIKSAKEDTGPITLKYNFDEIPLALDRDATYLFYLRDRGSGAAYEPVVIDDVVGVFKVEDGVVLDYFGEGIAFEEITY